MTPEENVLLTRTGPGTAMGDLLRRYWVPALLSEQVPEPDCPPLRVTLLGERLVAFRDSRGRVGLLEESCAHRGASLFFGRNEESGLRCAYHGWKYDVDGRCVDMPSEPAESNFKDKVRMAAYPCRERGGVIWAYMGPPHLQPALPEYEWAVVPASHRFLTRRRQECNWLQGLEGGFDPTHLAFLHRGMRDGDPGVRIQRSMTADTVVVPTHCGLTLASQRPVDADRVYWTVNQWMLPFHKLITRISADGPIGAHAWVPIDDERCMVYTVEYHPDRPLQDAEMEASRSWRYIHAQTLPSSDRPVRNQDNDYLIDRDLQRSGTSFTGILGIGMQDSAIQESMGHIYDRTREHLGTSDTAIIAIRRALLRALEEVGCGESPPGLDPAGQRVRSAGIVAPRRMPFVEAAGDVVRASSPSYAAQAATVV